MSGVYQEIYGEEIKTGIRTKNWDESKWIAFIEELIERHHEIRVKSLGLRSVPKRSFLAILWSVWSALWGVLGVIFGLVYIWCSVAS
jgi:hypothetical protein